MKLLLSFLTGGAGQFIGGLLLAAALVAGVGIYLVHRDAANYGRGHADAVAEWTADTARRQAQGLRLQADYRLREQGMAASVTAVADHYRKEIADEKSRTAGVNADLAAGRLRLTIPGAACPGGGGAAAAAGPAGGGDGAARSELPGQVAADLAALADDADEVTRQLGACQAILEAERGGKT